MDLLKQLSLTLRFIKLQRFLGSLSYPIQRDRLERQVKRSRSLEVFEEIGRYLKAKPTPKGGYFSFEHIELEITFLTADLVRLDWKPGIPPVPYAISRKD